ncbi:hypothetical protein ARMGADRAFT_1087820 [Armillaria gallica]|uniref:Uncharacterized protein n=1 Tax=Armillaria gallica TaxID=47427 RepID=A0A2H3D153_ARMGA|nr:hypothetical protein ARMGADRAFT_1087820 [Armillaria gallica]
METGQTRTVTPIPPTSLDPLSDEENYETPRPSLIQSPTRSIHSQIHTPFNLTMTPSTQEGQTTSGPSSRRSTEKSSVPIEAQHGNSDEETSSSDSSGPTLGIRESEWTSTWPPRVETQSWESKRMPIWPRGYMPTKPEASTHPTQARGYPTHDQGPLMNRQSSKPTYAPWQSSTRDGPFNRGFRLNEETFGAAIRDDDATLGWETYHGKGTSVLIAGAENDEQMEGGSGQPQQPGLPPLDQRELADHYAAALLQIAQLRNSENNLRDQLAAA